MILLQSIRKHTSSNRTEFGFTITIISIQQASPNQAPYHLKSSYTSFHQSGTIPYPSLQDNALALPLSQSLPS